MKLISKLIFTIVIFWGCEKDLTPVYNILPEIELTVEDVGVTEVWLKLETAGGKPEHRITITRNDSTINQFNNLTTDTVIYDSGLLPNNDYNYVTSLTTDSKSLIAESQLTTMDTTSHDFTWETFTFGDGGTCQFLDVSIVNENDIWATGQVWLKDSTGQFIHPPYNAIHWDGSEWEMMTTMDEGYGYGQIFSAFAFDSNNIWVGSTIPEHWDGNTWKFHGSDTGYPGGFYINKIYGSSSSDLYFVGSNGKITHFDGFDWQRIEGGTELPIQDIWGIRDSNNETQRILCVASEKYQSSDIKILQINPDRSVEEIYWVVPRRLHTVWFNSPNIFFIAGHGVFRKSSGLLLVYNELPDKFVNRIRGNSLNDVFICGDYGLLAHSNGLTWQEYSDPQLSSTLYESLDFKGNIVVAVGSISGRQAVISIGRRN